MNGLRNVRIPPNIAEIQVISVVTHPGSPSKKMSPTPLVWRLVWLFTSSYGQIFDDVNHYEERGNDTVDGSEIRNNHLGWC